MKVIPYGRQWIDEDDIQAVVRILRSDWITQGPAIERFEEELAAFCGARYAVAVSSGTAALHLACLAMGVKPGDEVITTPITFVASANCVLYCGGRPVFVDIDPATININPGLIEEYLASRARAGNPVKAVIPVHFAGLPCDMEAIGTIAEKYGVRVIEDACHALGAKYLIGKKWVDVGSCEHSDMTVFSFHPVKHITTGEGGAITTNDKSVYEKLKQLRTHGITKESANFTNTDLTAAFREDAQLNKQNWYYEMQELGFNYRITDFQSALGMSQLKKLRGWLDAREAITDRYDQAFSGLPEVSTPVESPNSRSAHHLYIIRVGARDQLFGHLRKQGIGVQVHYIPVHLQPYYRQSFSYQKGDFPAAERYYETTISLPVYPSMADSDVSLVIRAVEQFYERKNGGESITDQPTHS